MIFLKPEQYSIKTLPIFEDVKKHLNSKVAGGEIEHIGSTSISGALSKGDLDILLRVERKDFDKALRAVQSIGFRIKSDTLRTNSLCMLETDAYEIDVAIQLIIAGSEFEDFAAFRNILNDQPELVEKYNALKMKSKRLSHQEYRESKSQFIASVLENEVR